MYVKKIKYTDYNGTEREEKFYFHLNKAELMKMQFSVKGGFEAHLKRLLETQNEPEIMKIFEKYGFVKSIFGIVFPPLFLYINIISYILIFFNSFFIKFLLQKYYKKYKNLCIIILIFLL